MQPELFLVDYPPTAKYAEDACTGALEYDFDKMERCPKCGQPVSSGYWMRPREIVLTSRKLPDFLYVYCDGGKFLLSERALNAIREAGLTGILHAEEIEHIRFQRKAKKEVPIPKYYHIELARSRIAIDHEHSRIIYGDVHEERRCPLCDPRAATMDFIRRLAFHTAEYEGYDIFHTYETGGWMFLSRRFVDVCEAQKLTNLHYKPADKHETHFAAEFFADEET